MKTRGDYIIPPPPYAYLNISEENFDWLLNNHNGVSAELQIKEEILKE